jgi:transcriptional regulator with XRE-family HTH domain
MGKRFQQKIITREVKIIRAIREKKKLSVQKAAELVGTNKSTLTALENGRIDLSGEWIKRILKDHGVSEHAFNTDSHEPLNSRN